MMGVRPLYSSALQAATLIHQPFPTAATLYTHVSGMYSGFLNVKLRRSST